MPTEAETRPWGDERRVLVDDLPTVRVTELTLGPGRALPGHHHAALVDVFYCLEGWLVVDMGGEEHELRPGGVITVPPGTDHRPRNAGKAPVRFLLIQAGGAYDFLPAMSGFDSDD